MTSQTLISADRNLHLGDCSFTSDQLAPNCPTPWTVRMQRLHGGKQDGVDLITIDAGGLQVRVCPTRGMGIIDARKGDVRLGWDSPVKEIVNPLFVDFERRGGIGWLEGFNEFVVRCGLEFLGPPCSDPQHLAAGEAPLGDVTLHGKIANTPASEVELEVQTVAPYAITLRGVIFETAMYGPKFRLTAGLTIVPGESSFTINDEVTNVGGQMQEMCLLYHINQGAPMLEAGAKLVSPTVNCTPRDDHYTAKENKAFDRFVKPTAGIGEQVFFLDMKANKQGQVNTVLHNKNKTQGLGVSWKKQQLPNFTLWKAQHHESDGYVTGLEPCITQPLPRSVEREAGRVAKLKAGATYKADLTIDLLDGKQSVAKAVAQV